MVFTECLKSIDTELQNSFAEHKTYSRYLYEAYSRLHTKGCSFGGFDFSKKHDKVHSCADYLEFGVMESGKSKLINANFCKDKFCPMCSWRRSKKVYSQVHSCVDYMKNNYQFLLLTLTVPNVKASQLSDTITHLNYSFNKMVNYPQFQRIYRGCVKVLEVTYNRERDDFHPHFHILLAVSANYFRSDDYLKQFDFLYMWRKATKDNRINQVDIRKVHYNPRRPELSDISAAVAEVAKYAVKPSDYIFPDNQVLTDSVLYTLSLSLRNRRLVSFRGVFKEVRDILFGSDDCIDGDLLHIDDDKDDEKIIAICHYHWIGYKYRICFIDSSDYFVSDDVVVSSLTGEVLVEQGGDYFDSKRNCFICCENQSIFLFKGLQKIFLQLLV